MESGRKKKRPTKAKQNFKIPGEKKDPKTFQEKEKKACYIQRIKNQNNIKFLKNDTEARRSKFWEKIVF